MREQLDMSVFDTKDLEGILASFDSNVPEFFAKEEREDLVEYLKEPPGTYLTLRVNGQIIGGCGFLVEDDGVGKITWSFISREFHRRGYGREVVLYSLKKLREKGVTECAVRTSQHTHLFFATFGFLTRGYQKDYWAPGFDLYDMSQIM